MAWQVTTKIGKPSYAWPVLCVVKALESQRLQTHLSKRILDLLLLIDSFLIPRWFWGFKDESGVDDTTRLGTAPLWRRKGEARVFCLLSGAGELDPGLDPEVVEPLLGVLEWSWHSCQISSRRIVALTSLSQSSYTLGISCAQISK